MAVYPTKKYWANPACATKGVVLVGFSSIAEADIRPGIAALARAWFGQAAIAAAVSAVTRSTTRLFAKHHHRFGHYVPSCYFVLAKTHVVLRIFV